MSDENKCGSCEDTECNGRRPKPGENERDFEERQALEARMCGIKHKLVVLCQILRRLHAVLIEEQSEKAAPAPTLVVDPNCQPRR